MSVVIDSDTSDVQMVIDPQTGDMVPSGNATPEDKVVPNYEDAPTSNQELPNAPVIPTSVSVVQSAVAINPIFAKYGAAIIQVLLVAFTSFVALGNAPLTTTLLIQLGIAVVGAIGVYLVPLAKGAWAAIWKVIVAVAIAGATAVVPFATTGHLTLGNWIVVGGAVLTALATQLGVSVRTDSDAHLA